MIDIDAILDIVIDDNYEVELFFLLDLKKSYEINDFDKVKISIFEKVSENKFISSHELLLLLSSDILMIKDSSDLMAWVKKALIHSNFLKKHYVHFESAMANRKGFIAGMSEYLFAWDACANALAKSESASLLRECEEYVTSMSDLISSLLALTRQYAQSGALEACNRLGAHIKQIKDQRERCIETTAKHAEAEPLAMRPEATSSNNQTADIADMTSQASHQLGQMLASSKMMGLFTRINYLQQLIEQSRLFEAAIVLDDLQKKVITFDPREYFPKIFTPMYMSVAPIARELFSINSRYSGSIEWSFAKRLYTFNPEEFFRTSMIKSLGFSVNEDDAEPYRVDDLLDEMSPGEPLF